jgi:flagellar basal-body rod protein FlgG
VVGEDGPVNLPSPKVDIDEKGVISGPEGRVGKLSLYSVEDEQGLEKQGQNLWRRPEGAEEVILEDIDLWQRHLEEANVSPIKMTTRLIQTNRNFQSFQKAIQAYDQVAEKTNRVGQIG